MTDFTPRLDILPPAQRAVWYQLTCVPASFVLYGGTAVALRLAHRASVDFDLFNNDPFAPGDLLQRLASLPIAERLQSEPDTLTVVLDEDEPVKISFFGGLKLRRAGRPQRIASNGIAVASLLDLAATKIAVVQERAEQKDYLDIAAIIEAGITLEQALGAAQAVYREAFNPAITLKALTYFEDGELSTLPDTVKRSLREAATNVGPLAAITPESDRIDIPAR